MLRPGRAVEAGSFQSPRGALGKAPQTRRLASVALAPSRAPPFSPPLILRFSLSPFSTPSPPRERERFSCCKRSPIWSTFHLKRVETTTSVEICGLSPLTPHYSIHKSLSFTPGSLQFVGNFWTWTILWATLSVGIEDNRFGNLELEVDWILGDYRELGAIFGS